MKTYQRVVTLSLFLSLVSLGIALTNLYRVTRIIHPVVMGERVEVPGVAQLGDTICTAVDSLTSKDPYSFICYPNVGIVNTTSGVIYYEHRGSVIETKNRFVYLFKKEAVSQMVLLQRGL